MEAIKRTKIVDVLKSEAFGTTVNVKGWVRTRRGSKQVSFIALNDGSTINNVQIVVDVDKLGEEFLKPITTGASIRNLRFCRSEYLSFAEKRPFNGVPA